MVFQLQKKTFSQRKMLKQNNSPERKGGKIRLIFSGVVFVILGISILFEQEGLSDFRGL